jgi:hypothetical protein
MMYLEQDAVQRSLINNITGENGLTLWHIRHREVVKPRSKLWTEMTFHPDLIELWQIVCPVILSLCH